MNDYNDISNHIIYSNLLGIEPDKIYIDIKNVLDDIFENFTVPIKTDKFAIITTNDLYIVESYYKHLDSMILSTNISTNDLIRTYIKMTYNIKIEKIYLYTRNT